MTTSPIERAADSFAAELARHRTGRGLSKKQLATLMGFDPSYVSHVEGRRHRPTEDFARRAEAVLEASGAIWQRFREYDELRHGRAGGAHRDPPVPGQWLPPGTGLVVEREVATLTHIGDGYHCAIRRELYNAGTEPVTRYLVRVAVDRYPNDPGRSNRHHREHPLTFAELQLTAYRDDGNGREPMHWRAKHDRDAFKEIWLLFENDEGRFPLYPGDRVTIEYAYRVGQDKWGPWFQRAVRLPTRHLAVRLDLPADLDPKVWGAETSLSAEEGPLRTPIQRASDGDRVIFDWGTDDPPLNARYRMQWRFRSPQADAEPDSAPTGGARVRASDRMRAVGIVQRGDDLLRQPARQFDLPAEERHARQVIDRLAAMLARLDELHPFSKGVGLAAPQLGIGWSAALVRPADRAAEPVVLLNPRVVDTAAETDEQYEGCLSFFDHRGLVPRPLRIDVEHALWDGSRVITSFEYAMARLVAHEIDHLDGRLYVDRMAPGVPLVPVEEYRETGTPWRY
ncbi:MULTISPECIES: peptide deformylase [Micromonospora]|uniref:Peptide deformylase n=1 Tax=Micromonospora chalcea TaxID=1874 RepID=A0ABX9YDJ6_MICCH|nr:MULTISPECIES: peptide deformylase [Micromonospora]MBC8994271.1 peptide deformylase [Micromonospora chalcea]MBP1786214.1 peptide deformylase [Micromonospora sp. HB375]MBQ1060553.1 peptide deformylase [Micromonospora sp. C41]MBQ1068428.1 peptide deformylase [Micromonospora sp. D75]MDH6471859.1 peptide deformylase [Micromonospora sp. H404/HB375]